MERLRPGEPEERDRHMAMSDVDLNEIRPAIIKLIIDKKPVRLDSILQQLTTTNPEWLYSSNTLRKGMLKLGIVYDELKDYYYERLK